MALTLVKEDGTGKPDANSYADVTDGDAYHDGHLYATAWTGATVDRKAAALVMATRLIDSQFQFNGRGRTTSRSSMALRSRIPATPRQMEWDAGKKVLVTSVVTRMEILRSTLTKEQNGKYDLLFKRKSFQEMPIDKRVVAMAHDLRDFYQQQKAKDGLATLTTPDSIHLATAIVWKVECFYTFDAKDKAKKARALLPLNGNVAGHNLTIQKPLAMQTHFLHKMDATLSAPKAAPAR